MPLPYVLSPMAEADLEEIWTYTAQEWSIGQAEVYSNDIIDAFEDIAEGKKTGRPATIREGYLKSSVGKHVFYFHIQGDMVVIVRVLHQSMDVERHF